MFLLASDTYHIGIRFLLCECDTCHYLCKRIRYGRIAGGVRREGQGQLYNVNRNLKLKSSRSIIMLLGEIFLNHSFSKEYKWRTEREQNIVVDACMSVMDAVFDYDLDLDYVAVAGLHHTSWVAFDAPTDRPKSVRNRCVIEVFGGVCVLSFCFFGFFCGCSCFCHRT